MKLQQMIRIQMLLVGMGAGLLLARSAVAQQEMDPELFDVYANTTVMDQASHRTPGAEAVKVAAADSPAPSAAQGVDAEGLTAVDTSVMLMLMLMLIICIGSIVLFGMAEAVRGPRRLTWRETAPGRLPHGSDSQLKKLSPT